MTTIVVVYSDETDPDTRLAWKADVGLRNFTGWTLTAEVVNRETNVLVLTKTTGVTGGDGTGTSNVNIAWTAAELGGLTAEQIYKLRVTATLGAEKAVFKLNDSGSLPGFKVIAKPTP